MSYISYCQTCCLPVFLGYIWVPSTPSLFLNSLPIPPTSCVTAALSVPTPHYATPWWHLHTTWPQTITSVKENSPYYPFNHRIVIIRYLQFSTNKSLSHSPCMPSSRLPCHACWLVVLFSCSLLFVPVVFVIALLMWLHRMDGRGTSTTSKQMMVPIYLSCPSTNHTVYATLLTHLAICKWIFHLLTSQGRAPLPCADMGCADLQSVTATTCQLDEIEVYYDEYGAYEYPFIVILISFI